MKLIFFTLIFACFFAVAEEKKADSKNKSNQEDAKKKLEKMIGDITEELKNKGDLSSKSLAQALKDKMKAKAEAEKALNKNAKPTEKEIALQKQKEKHTELIIKKIENLQVPPDKLKQAAIESVMQPEDKNKAKDKKVACIEEKANCEVNACCDGLTCGTYYFDQPVDKKLSEKRCMKPLELGASCVPFQSVCKIGLCNLYNINSTHLPICVPVDQKCTKNEDCCSNQCSNKLCVQSFRCTQCIDSGNKPKAGEKCCEGFYIDENGACMTDYPPAPVTMFKKKNSFLETIFDLIIQSAEAQAPTPVPTPDPYSNVETCTFNSKRNYHRQLFSNTNAMSTGKTYGDATKAAIDATRAFEFVAIGPGVEDFFKENGQASIHGRAKAAAEKIKANRIESEKNFQDLDDFMKCSCIEIRGITDPKLPAELKTWYTASGKCPGATVAKTAEQAMKDTMAAAQAQNGAGKNAQSITNIQNHLASGVQSGYSNVTDGITNADDNGVGASGLKYKEMLVNYYAKRIEIQGRLFKNNAAPYNDILLLRDYISNYNKWDEVIKEVRTKDESHWTNVWEEIGNFLVNIFSTYYRSIFGAVEGLMTAFQSTSLWSGVPDIWKGAVTPPRCTDRTESKWDFTDCAVTAGYCGSTNYRHCEYDYVLPNRVCGRPISNSLCMKSAVQRGDHGKQSQNQYIIDPFIPSGYTAINLDMGISNLLDFNNSNAPSFTPPMFTDAHYNTFKTLAIQYAKDNDFYETDAERESFADIAFEYHFINPHISESKKMNYKKPGLATYLQDMVAHIMLISDTSIQTQGNDIQNFIDYANDYVKTHEKLAKGNQKSTIKKVDQVKNAIELAGIHMANIKAQQFTNPQAFPEGKLGSTLSGESLGGMYGGMQNLSNYKLKQKKKYDTWMKAVGNTPKGEALLKAKAAMQAKQVVGGSTNSGNSSSGNTATASLHQAPTPAKTAEKVAEKIYDVEEQTYRNDSDSRSNRRKTSEGIDNEIKDQKELDHVLGEAKSNIYDAQEGDTIWVIITKAYVRGGYPRLLTVKPSLETNDGKEAGAQAELADDEKVFAPTKSKKRKMTDQLKTLDEVK
ncbi:MAG: hypothetical protein ACOYL6_10045 [Bacteriovoracaceae bacterium]